LGLGVEGKFEFKLELELTSFLRIEDGGYLENLVNVWSVGDVGEDG